MKIVSGEAWLAGTGRGPEPHPPAPSGRYGAPGATVETESKQARYLGLDIGTKRIGIAVSDELGLTAQPVMTLEARRNPREGLRSIGRLARRYGVTAIIVGLPLHLSGEDSPRAARVRQFAAELGTLTGLPIHLWDERLTTREAHQMLYEAGHARQDHQKVVDQVAAVLILDSWMQENHPAK